MIRKSRGKGKGLQFLEEAISSDSQDCIIWPFYKMKNGYGQVGAHDGMHLAHRYVCTRVHGNPPEEKSQARHLCGNRACVNPKHIRWGSQKQNEDDKHNHGTWYKRISNGKWSESVVRSMREDYDMGVTPKIISEKYNVPWSTVMKIVRRETWKHLP